MLPVDKQKHKIVAYQKQQQEYDVDHKLVTRTKSFPVGSLFYYTVQTAAPESLVSREAKNKSSNNILGFQDDEDYDDDDDDDDEKSRNPLTIEVPPMTKLSIDTVTVDPKHSQSTKDIMSLYVSTDSNEFVCIIPSLTTKTHDQAMVQNLNIDVIGPTSVQFALVYSNPKTNTIGHVNIFGRVGMIDEDIGNTVVDARTTHVFDELQEMNDAESEIDAAASVANTYSELSFDDGAHTSANAATSVTTTSSRRPSKVAIESVEKVKNDTVNDKGKKKDENDFDDKDSDKYDINGVEQKKKKFSETKVSNEEENNAVEKVHSAKGSDKNEKKRKMNDQEQTETDDKTSDDPVAKIQKLSKKQRRKLAKQKAKELQEVIAQQQGHATITNDKEGETIIRTKANESKTVSLTKKRALAGGVLVQDIVHGTGPNVRLGRKVSINYVGTLSGNGKEFDKNVSKANPLVFRVGTGEVIKGLEKGMEGMRVGGERSITIPPELGYGRKRSGKIPPNSTLCFDVKLLSIGGTQK